MPWNFRNGDVDIYPFRSAEEKREEKYVEIIVILSKQSFFRHHEQNSH